MEWIGICKKGKDFLRKYRYAVCVLLAGFALMLIPENSANSDEITQTPNQTEAGSSESLQNALSELLSKIEGAGKVQVLLSTAEGEKTIYQTNQDISSGENTESIRRETVVISGDSRQETGLVQQIYPPVYLGAIVLCQGADSAMIRLSIVEAVANATGLSTDKISVLKMK